MYIFNNYRYDELNIWIVLLKQLEFFITDKDKAFQGLHYSNQATAHSLIFFLI